jgi:hypothetical protein
MEGFNGGVNSGAWLCWRYLRLPTWGSMEDVECEGYRREIIEAELSCSVRLVPICQM